MKQFELKKRTKNIIAVVGVGGGGCNAVSNMYQKNGVEVDFILLNTDSQALENSFGNEKILIGPNITQGRGSGAIPGIGRKAALESKEVITKVLSNYSMVFICAGLGGGTGTGASPVITEIAKELGVLTISLVTIPFTFEGKHRFNQGSEGLEILKMCGDSLIIILNDNILKEFGGMSMSKAFLKSDLLLFDIIKSISELVTNYGSINIDFNDVKNFLQDSGICLTGTASAQGLDRAERVVANVIKSPSFEQIDINKIKKMLISISTSSNNELSMSELSEVTELLTKSISNSSEIIFGASLDESLDEKIKLTVVCVLGKQSFKESQEESDKIKIGMAPFYLEPSLKKINHEYKGESIAFIIMQFKDNPIHLEIFDVIKLELDKYNIKALRADQREYSEDLLTNTLTYIHAAQFGIAIYDRITEDSHNPNVSFELGYMMGLNKNVLLLKDSLLNTLHTDLAGRIYQTFDIFKIKETIPPVLNKWLRDKNMI